MTRSLIFAALLLVGCGGGIDTPDEFMGPPAPIVASAPANNAGRADPCPSASKTGNPQPICDPADTECLCGKKVPG